MARVGDLTFAVGRESTVGTAVSPTRRFEVIDENLKLTIDRVESKALKNSRRFLSSTGWAAGVRSVEGDFSMEVPSAGFGTLLRALLGAPSTTADSPVAGAYTHRFNSNTSIDAESLTCEIVRTDVSGDQHKFTYSGVTLGQAEFSASVGEFVNAKFTVDGWDEAYTTAAPTSATYPTATPLVFTGATLTVDGTATPIKSCNIKFDTGRKGDRYFLGSNFKKAQVEAGLRDVSGTIDVEWDELTLYNKYTSGSTAELVFQFRTQQPITGSTYGSVIVTVYHARFDGETPTSNGNDIITQNVSFKAVDAGTSPSVQPVSIYVTSLDSTY
jgi:hypothetical protein